MGGITVHQMDAVFDNGPVILQVPVPIQPQVTYGILNTQLAYAGLQVAQHLLQLLDAGSIHATPQDETQACWHRKPEPGRSGDRLEYHEGGGGDGASEGMQPVE